MNKWQKVYCDTYYDGKEPETKRGKRDMELLAKIKNKVIVTFPKIDKFPRFEVDHIDTFIVTENDCDMSNGKISVMGLVENLEFWDSRFCIVETE